MTKPYSKIYIIKLLLKISKDDKLSVKERKIILQQLTDLYPDTNGLEIYKQEADRGFAMAGSGAELNFGKGTGDNGSWSSTYLIKPYFSGDLGDNLTFTAGVEAGLEQLSSGLFYESYTKDGKVHFPNEKYGYSYLPYQFSYKTSYITDVGGKNAAVDSSLQQVVSSNIELNGSWFDGKLRMSVNNQNRSWGHTEKNLLLSGGARRFPGIEMHLHPVSWFKYSYVVGSLFFIKAERANYKKGIYGEDLGSMQKNYSCHMIELVPTSWLKLTGAANAIWSKRFELGYILPFTAPPLVQNEIGDDDNPSLYIDIATKFPGFGKTWLGFYVDDFSWLGRWQMLKNVPNKYAIQVGWKTTLLSSIIPGTTSTLGYTRLSPFVYTHYPETAYAMGTNRPIDMTYTHDGSNLGYYLPPNSGELTWSLVNIAIPNLVLELDNRLIIHGTNDLASENIYQIYGDIYHHHEGNIRKYPIMDFTKDGIYDFTIQSELKFDWKIRTNKINKAPNYYRLNGSLGYSRTRWESNNSGVLAPPDYNILTGSVGIIIEM